MEVSADEDDDASNDSATLTHTAAGADYGSVSKDLPVTVTDNDTASTGIGLTLNPDSVSEHAGATAIAVTAALDGAVQTVPTEVTVAVADDTATAGTDFAAVAGVTLTIAAGATSGAATFMLTPIDDEIAEEDETLEVSGTVTAGTTLPVSSAKLTLTDDDEPSLTVAFAEDLYTVGEGATVEVEVTLSRDPGSTVTIPLTATAGSGLAASDYTGVPASIAFNAGETGKSFTVTAHQDRVAEASETVTLGFGPLPEGVSEGSRASTQVSIADDDTRRVAVAPTELELAEGESGSYTVVLESQPTGAVTVTVAAPAEAQFTVDETVLTFAAESWETARTVTVTVTAAVDANAATPPPATLTHGVSGADYEGMAADSVTVSIPEAVSAMDHELTLAVAPAEVTESAGSTRITVTGTLNTALSQEASFTVAVTGETAVATDFAAAAPVTLTIAAGQSIGTASFTLTPVDDALDEANETLKVSGTTPLPELTVIPATLTIIDDDAPPPVLPKAAASAARAAESSAARAAGGEHRGGRNVSGGGPPCALHRDPYRRHRGPAGRNGRRDPTRQLHRRCAADPGDAPGEGAHGDPARGDRGRHHRRTRRRGNRDAHRRRRRLRAGPSGERQRHDQRRRRGAGVEDRR